VIRSPSLLLQLLPQERIGQGAHEGSLFVVGGCAVAAFDVLVEQHVVAHLNHLRCHLPGMAGVDPVIPRGSCEQRPGVADQPGLCAWRGCLRQINEPVETDGQRASAL
jgi:hypothetical protein